MMIDETTKSNLDIFDNSTIDDSGGVESLVNLDNSSHQSDLMGIDINSDVVTVTETLQGLIQESASEGGDSSANIDSYITTGASSFDDPITNNNTKQSLIFSDREKGTLDDNDLIYQGGYRDEYRLTGFSNNETIILDLKAFDFGSSLQLINGETGETIKQSDVEQKDGSINNQLMFTPDTDIEYVVRVTSIEEATTGTYSLGTTSGELTEKLIFSDTETGILDSSDQTFQGRYRDEYILRGLEDQQTVILELENVGFGSSLQLVNRETGELIDHYEVTETEGTSYSRLQFTSSNEIEYLVRVTSTGDSESITGNYTLGTTLGELTLGISDQTIKGTLSDSDEMIDLWRGRYTDRYEITNVSPEQTINIDFNSSDYSNIVFLINADTGGYIWSNISSYDRESGIYTSQITYTAREDVNYAVVVSSYMSRQMGDYSLTIDTKTSVSGGFDINDDDAHPILKTRLMDNYLLSDVQVGEDVKLNFNSSSSNNLVQLYDQDTGDVLQTTTEANLQFTVEEGINYGVRVLGEAGETYSLTTDTGLLFDSNVIGLNETITSSLVTSDARLDYKEYWSYHRFYSDGYYFSADSLQGQDELTIKIDAEFAPEVHIVNAQTGEFLDFDRTLYRTNLTHTFDVEDNIDYLILVTSRHNGQIGEYTLSLTT